MQQGRTVDIEPAPSSSVLSSAVRDYGKCSGVPLRLERLAINKLSTNLLPLALRRRRGDFVVLARLSDSQALIQSPTSNVPEIISRECLAHEWEGEVIRVRQAGLRFDLSWFFPELLKHRRLLAEVLLLSLLLQVLALSGPLFFQAVMDKVLLHHATATLDVLVMALVVVGVFEVVLKGLREDLAAHTANRIDIGLGVKLFRHLLGLPLLYFKQRQVGTVVARLKALETIREFLTGSLLTLCLDLVFTLVFLLVMASLSLSLTLLVLATLPLYGLLAWGCSAALERRVEHQFQSAARNTAFLNEAVSCSETVKSLAMEPHLQRRWEAQTQEMVEAGLASQTLGNGLSQCVALLQKLTSVAVICWGANQVIGLELTLGQLIAFTMMLTHVSQPLGKLVDIWQQFIQVRVAVDKLGDMLNLPVEQCAATAQRIGSLRGEVRIEQLSFRYRPDLPWVLHGLDLHIEPGQALGIVGPSGSGKSTLSRLLQKLYIADSGSIQIDNVALDEIDPVWLRAKVGVVLQENYLFNRTIRQNIALGHPTAEFDEVIEAARLAGAHEFILQLPLGYDTLVAEGGCSLSGGQRQRIAIARALLGDPPILIFDEATSALDDESQAMIQANMARIAHGRTLIIIAHRLSAVRHCPHLVVMEHGRIIEAGGHQQLMALGGAYAKLWRAQQALGGGQV